MHSNIVPQLFRHYKGGMYKVLGYVRHAETQERLVLYKSAEKINSELWIRPMDIFYGKVTVDGKEKQRFSFIKNLYNDIEHH